MSASNKKKLRKEQFSDMLSEKQKQERAEAKKLKTYTISFVVAMALVVCAALAVLGVRAVNNSGIVQKNTIAATIGDRELSSVEMSYYYIDAVNKFYEDMSTSYGDSASAYLEAMGLNTSVALDQQTYSEETGETWADYFLNTAMDQAASDYALYDLATKEEYKLSDSEQESVDSYLNNIEVYAQLYGYSNVKQFLRANYGFGADKDSYSEYYERGAIARSYYNAYPDTLSYDDDAIKAHDAENAINFNSYDYSSCYLSYTYFRQGGTEDEEGTVTYSEDENNAARDAMKTVAEALATATSVEELEAKVKEIEVNEGTTLSVSHSEDALYSSINTAIAAWLTEEGRKEGDITAIPNTSTTENEDGSETTVTNGYYVVIYHGLNTNETTIGNVRHLLVSFEGGTEDEETGETVYSDEEKATAKEAAEKYLTDWKAGDATEESFIALVKEHSDDSSAEEGGLFENVCPDGTYVAEFQNWALDENRKEGDAEVIETQFGYHVMYYVGASEMTYRTYMITEELRAADFEEWYAALTKDITKTLGDTSKMTLGLIVAPQ